MPISDRSRGDPLPSLYRHVTVEGRSVAFVDRGPREAPPLVLLHGAGFDHARLTWRITTGALCGDFRVVVPDLPGYGRSKGLDDPHDLPRLGQWLVHFLDAVDLDRADVAGVSMGGGMALWLAVNHPARVRRLVLVGTYGIMARLPLHPLAHLAAEAGGMALAYAGAGRSRMLTRLGLAASYGPKARITPRIVAEVMAVARDQLTRRSFDAFLHGELRRNGLKSDLRSRLGDIRQPTLVVHGRSDRVVPVRHARAAAARISGAEYLELPAGHWPMQECPKCFNAALRQFLTEN